MSEIEISRLLNKIFPAKVTQSIIGHYSQGIHQASIGLWEIGLFKIGKFVEAVIKGLWLYGGRTLPRPKDFTAGAYAQKIISGVTSTDIPSDGLRLQIPRACIFLYDITSNRGGRHDSQEFDPNEMDAICVIDVSTWILAELTRFSSKGMLVPDEAKRLVESAIPRKVSFYEKIDDRIYVDKRLHKSANECALLILARTAPGRIPFKQLKKAVMRHSYNENSLRIDRLKPFIDIDKDGGMLIRREGQERVEKLSHPN